MPASPTDRIYWDANVFLSVLEGDPSRGPVLEAILARVRSSSGKQEIVTSTLSITEVAFGAEEAMGEPLNATLEDQIDSFWDDPSTIKLREFDRIVAREARSLIRAARSKGWSLKPADAIHLASAKMVVASEIHTYDASLFKYAELIGISVREPYTDQLQLI